ncbi:MAG: methyltransferase domain-containing protein [Chloroflexi bacterium]|nr:methyltransferase domain-containing protein [Chloroflexota bacterium]
MNYSRLKSPLASKKVRYFLSHFVRGNRAGIRKARLVGKEYLDVGCGNNTHDIFINLDYVWHPNIDICWDITKGIPLPDNAIKGIYSEHCIEHIPLTDAIGVFAEFTRLLMPGGNIRIVVPDGELYVKRYLARHNKVDNIPFPYEYQDPVNGLYTPMMSLNRIFRKWGHMFIYDFESLQVLLSQYGFVDIKRETYMSGRNQNLLNDTESRAEESLYVEATLPQAK